MGFLKLVQMLLHYTVFVLALFFSDSSRDILLYLKHIIVLVTLTIFLAALTLTTCPYH